MTIITALRSELLGNAAAGDRGRLRAALAVRGVSSGSGPSIPLLRVFGIRIGASPSWFVVLFLFIYLGANHFREILGGSVTEAYVVAVAGVFLFFVSLVLHELGHALVARREGSPSTASTCGSSAGWPRWRATRNCPARSSAWRRPARS